MFMVQSDDNVRSDDKLRYHVFLQKKKKKKTILLEQNFPDPLFDYEQPIALSSCFFSNAGSTPNLGSSWRI